MKRAFLVVLVVALASAFFVFELDRFLSLEYLKSQHAAVTDYYRAHPARTAAAFFFFYVTVTTLSIPGGAVLSLAAGAVFGLAVGTLLVSFASSIGALAAFLVVRYLLRDIVQRRFGAKLRALNAGVERDGAFYLFALRLVPAVPFFVVNLTMPLTPIRPWTYYWVSQLGMLAGTVVYINAGTQLARVETIGDVLSLPLIASLTLLGVFPFLARAALDAFRSRRLLARYPKPARFDRNLVVIGAGSAGLVCAYIAATVKAKVTLVERNRMGGDCLNTGCVPSKALIRSARLFSHVRRGREFGVANATITFEFADLMARVRRVIARVAPHDSVERYAALGVECIEGDATIATPYRVDIRTAQGMRSLTTRAIVVATGARPFIPPLAGIDPVQCLTSDSVWDLHELPRRLLVLGGGPIGCELAQCFARLGSEVTLVEMQPRLLFKEDAEVSSLIAERFAQEGIRVLTSHTAKRLVDDAKTPFLVCAHGDDEIRIEFDRVLCALGRKPHTGNLGLEALGIGLTPAGAVEVDDYGRTRVPTIFACGDVTGGYQFTHTAAHTAWYATVNALFGSLRRFRIDTRSIPWCTFTDPEVARAGSSEIEAIEQGIAHEVTLYRLDELDRAITDEAAIGFVKVITVPGKDRILGVTIVAEHAGELIAEYVLAMKHGIGLNRILGTIHVYPTFAEANKYAAGQWKKAHAPQRLLRLVERFHAWKRA
ncbi:MAG: NAD(P)-binding protein [Betaproteobacteria bacterium]|nr:NAD(P)-binding protein [Betaproteobacteria bacterium]